MNGASMNGATPYEQCQSVGNLEFPYPTCVLAGEGFVEMSDLSPQKESSEDSSLSSDDDTIKVQPEEASESINVPTAQGECHSSGDEEHRSNGDGRPESIDSEQIPPGVCQASQPGNREAELRQGYDDQMKSKGVAFGGDTRKFEDHLKAKEWDPSGIDDREGRPPEPNHETNESNGIRDAALGVGLVVGVLVGSVLLAAGAGAPLAAAALIAL
jgi:hypothetical protein